MSLGALLVILVAAGDAQTVSSETVVALVAAAQSALPHETSVRLLAVPDPEREDLTRVEERLGARAVASLTWSAHPGGVRASLRMHVAGGGSWTARTIAFLSGDPPSERGRTVGFAIAALWPGLDVDRPPNVAPIVQAAAPARPVAADASTAAVLHTEVGLGVVGATGLGGPAGAVGGTADVSWKRFHTVGLRGVFELRGGPLAALRGFDWVIAAGGGIEWWPLSLAWASRGALGVYGDLLWTAHWVRRESSGDSGESRGRMLPAVDLGLAASLPVRSSFRLVMALGGELALGRTDLRTGDDHVVVATIPPARAVARVVLRYAF